MTDDVFYVKQGDNEPSITATLLDPDNNPVDLTGASVTFRMSGPATVSGNATIVNPATSGVVQFDWPNGSLDVWGGYQAEWIVTMGGTTQTFPSDGYNWVEVLPASNTNVGAAATLSDVRRQAGRVLTPEEQARTPHLLISLTRLLERKLNRKLVPTTITDETHTIGSDGGLYLTYTPTTVLAISVDGTPWDGVLADYPRIAWSPGSVVTVTYTTGAGDEAIVDLVSQIVARTLLSPAVAATGAINSYAVEGTSITYGSNPNTPGQVGRLTVGDLGALVRLRRPVLR